MSLEFEADSVEVSQRLYFTDARCRAAVAESRAQASWLPASGDDGDTSDVATARASLAFGGC